MACSKAQEESRIGLAHQSPHDGQRCASAAAATVVI
jgi:hypothetical protein